MPERTRRSPARFLAPLALVGFLLVFLVVVTSAGDGGDGEKGSDRPAATSTGGERSERDRPDDDDGGETTATTRRAGRKTYTIKAGDTLGGIADRTGVPLERLQELNPDLDPQAMVAGQRIKLRE